MSRANSLSLRRPDNRNRFKISCHVINAMQAVAQKRSSERSSRKRRKASEQEGLSGYDGVTIQGTRGRSAHLKFLRIFKKKGKQGITGMCLVDGEERVFKMSRYINHTVRHEMNILKSIGRISEFCPYFCTGGELWNVDVSKDFREQSNPFATGKGKHVLNVDLLTMNYMKGRPFSSLVKEEGVSDAAVFSCVKQVLAAVNIAQREERFTHYDLHSSNVLVKPCPQNSVALFLAGGFASYTPSYGLQPMIIDFGFSHARESEKKPIYSSLAHTDIGFLTHRPDFMSDPKLFLISIAYEMKLYRETSVHCSHFRKVVRKIFRDLPTDSNSGWDKGYTKISAIDAVTDLTNPRGARSPLFNRYNHFALDVMQTMIRLPLRRKGFEEIALAFKTIDTELFALSNELGSPIFTVYLFQKMVDLAAALRQFYNNKQTRSKAVKVFKKMFLKELDKISRYCLPKISFDKLLCGLYVYADCIEGVLHSECTGLWEKKKADYERMEQRDIEEVLGYLDEMLPDGCQFTEETEIRVSDSDRRLFQSFQLSRPEARYLNSIPTVERGLCLRQIYEGRLEAPPGESESDEEYSGIRGAWDDLMAGAPPQDTPVLGRMAVAAPAAERAFAAEESSREIPGFFAKWEPP